MYIHMLLNQRPVKPAGLVVLAVGVVVTALGASHLVAHQNHRQTQREHRRGQKILHLPVSQPFHRKVVGWALDTAVPASVVVRAVVAILPVRLVVLLVVRDEVVEGEAIVAGHEVDALLRLAFLVTVNLGAAEQPVREAWHETLVAAEEAADIVAKSSVPLPPTVADEAPDLVEAGRV